MTGFVRRGLVALGAVAAITPFAMILGPAPSAQALACGYSVQLEDVPSTGFSAAVGPISAPLGGGQRQIAHWGNCSPGRTQLTIMQKNGSTPACVTPGDTRLGIITGSNGVTGATATGTC